MYTRDKRTPVSYENILLKTNIEKNFEFDKKENLLEQKKSFKTINEFFKSWYQTQKRICSGIGKTFMVAKHPLLIFAIEDIFFKI